MASLFFSYSHADESLRDQLEKQLAMLRREGAIETWHDRAIGAGQDIDKVIDEHINTDDIILLLVSPDFLASNYCYDVEMQRAMQRHNAGEATVIPVILRPCDWHGAPFGRLNASPPDGKPVTKWANIDEAFLEVTKAVRAAVARLGRASPRRQVVTSASDAVEGAGVSVPASPRSSNLRLAKNFTQRDKDRFQVESFDYVARYFENSLGELNIRNSGIEVDFRRVDASRFFATVYRDGKDVTRATIFSGADAFGPGIKYTTGETMQSNTCNHWLTVEADEQALYLRSTMSFGRDGDRKLSQEGAAEMLWSEFIAPLQQSRY